MNVLEQLDAAYAAATQGKWKLKDRGDDAYLDGTYGLEAGPSYDQLICHDNPYYNHAPSKADAHLIELMQNNLPALIEAAKFLEMLAPYLDERQQPGEMWAALGCRQVLAKLKGESV